jgi:hypothetical protein
VSPTAPGNPRPLLLLASTVHGAGARGLTRARPPGGTPSNLHRATGRHSALEARAVHPGVDAARGRRGGAPVARSRGRLTPISLADEKESSVIEVATIAQAVAVISACWAIVSGVGAWKREFIGKRQIELAEQLLAKFFEVKDAIAFIRNPFSSSDEGKSRQRAATELPQESELLDRGDIVVERYQKKEGVFAEFNTLKYRCMATFGADTERAFVETKKR